MKPSQQAAKKTPGFPGGNRPRQPSSAARILSRGPAGYGDDYSTMDWLLLFATLIVICLICFCFTPYTHQLDEIKNVFLQFFPPVLLIWAVVMKDFRSITWKTQAPVIFLGLYTLFMTFSWAINDYKIVNERVIWFHAGCATFTIIFAWFINSENKMRKVILFWVLLALASALLGILFYAGHIIQSLYNKASGGAHTQWGNLFYTLLKAKDMYSFILNEDFYAAFILMLCFFPAAMFFAEDKRRYKILGLVTFILLCICMAFTYSNDTFISALFGVPLFVGLCL